MEDTSELRDTQTHKTYTHVGIVRIHGGTTGTQQTMGEHDAY